MVQKESEQQTGAVIPEMTLPEQNDRTFRYRVSVIITCYNQEEFIGQAVKSALSQETNFPFQVIVGDDASTDTSPQILEELKTRYPDKLRVIRHPHNLGVLRNRPVIMREADSPYLAMLDGDDYFTDCTQLQRKYDFLEQSRKYIGYFTGGYRMKNGVLGTQTDFETYDCFHSFGCEDALCNQYPGMPSGFFFRNLYRMDSQEFCERLEAVPSDAELPDLEKFLKVMDEAQVDVSSKLPIVLGQLGEIYRNDHTPTYIYRDMAGTVSKHRDGLNYYKSRIAMQEMTRNLFGAEMKVTDQMEDLVWNAFADAARAHFRRTSIEMQQFLYMWNDGYFSKQRICRLILHRASQKLMRHR